MWEAGAEQGEGTWERCAAASSHQFFLGLGHPGLFTAAMGVRGAPRFSAY